MFSKKISIALIILLLTICSAAVWAGKDNAATPRAEIAAGQKWLAVSKATSGPYAEIFFKPNGIATWRDNGSTTQVEYCWSIQNRNLILKASQNGVCSETLVQTWTYETEKGVYRLNADTYLAPKSK